MTTKFAFDYSIGCVVRAIEDTTEFTGQRLGEISVSDAILSAANALIASRHEEEMNRLHVMGAQVEATRTAVKLLLAVIESKGVAPVADDLTDHERKVIFGALEADYIQNGEAKTIDELDARRMRLRFKKIAGL